MEDRAITFKWETGHIDIMLSSVLDMSAVELKKFVSAATLNGEEIKAEIADFLRPFIHAYSEDSNYAKKAEKYKKLMAVVEDRKLTKTDKIIQKLFNNKYPNPICHAVFEDAGKYCATDGHILFRFSSPLSSDIPVISYGYVTTKAIGDLNAYSVSLELPNSADLRKDIKIVKHGVDIDRVHALREGNKIIAVYDFGYGLPKVNAEYLLSMLEALPDCKARAYSGNTHAPVYFVSGESDGIILPIRVAKEYESAPAEIEVAEAVEAVEAVNNPETENAIAEADHTIADGTEKTSGKNAVSVLMLPAPADVLMLPAYAPVLSLPAHVEVEAPEVSEAPDSAIVSIIDGFRKLYFDGTHTIEMLSASLAILGFVSSQDAIVEAFNFLGLEMEADHETVIEMDASMPPAVVVAVSVAADVSDSALDVSLSSVCSSVCSSVDCDSLACAMVCNAAAASGIAGAGSAYGDSVNVYRRSAISQGYVDTGQHAAHCSAFLTACMLSCASIHPKAYKPPGYWISALSAFYT